VLLAKYKKPLLAAAFDLQSRLKNMCMGRGMVADFSERAVHAGISQPGRDADYVLFNTLYCVGDLLGWIEIVRQEVVFLEGFPNISELMDAVSFQLSGETFIQGGPELNFPFPPYNHAKEGDPPAFRANPDADEGFMRFQLYAGEQRAIGEAMIEETHMFESATGAKKAMLRTMGFNTFFSKISATPSKMTNAKEEQDLTVFQRAFESLKLDLHHLRENPGMVPRARLQALQIVLCKLIDELDPQVELLDEDDPRFKPKFIIDTVAKLRNDRDNTDDETDDVFVQLMDFFAASFTKGRKARSAAARKEARKAKLTKLTSMDARRGLVVPAFPEGDEEEKKEEEADPQYKLLILNPEWTPQLIDRVARRLKALPMLACHRDYFETLHSFKEGSRSVALLNAKKGFLAASKNKPKRAAGS